jgi:hypothetical protein
MEWRTANETSAENCDDGYLAQTLDRFGLEILECTTANGIDAAVTFGILWREVCWQAQAANLLVEGLKTLVPEDVCSRGKFRLPLQGLGLLIAP